MSNLWLRVYFVSYFKWTRNGATYVSFSDITNIKCCQTKCTESPYLRAGLLIYSIVFANTTCYTRRVQSMRASRRSQMYLVLTLKIKYAISLSLATFHLTLVRRLARPTNPNDKIAMQSRNHENRWKVINKQLFFLFGEHSINVHPRRRQPRDKGRKAQEIVDRMERSWGIGEIGAEISRLKQDQNHLEITFACVARFPRKTTHVVESKYEGLKDERTLGQLITSVIGSAIQGSATMKNTSTATN